jgi:hypothetical protein
MIKPIYRLIYREPKAEDGTEQGAIPYKQRGRVFCGPFYIYLTPLQTGPQ